MVNRQEEVFQFRKVNNNVYYNDIACPMCKTPAIIEENEKDLSINILNCDNFHFLKNINL